MAKLGRQFEDLVADVAREFEPAAKVTVSEWVSGPDGLREIDVLIAGNVEGRPTRVQIECKDYNPAKRPIGIGAVDAVESKHRDLGVDLSLICSNAGFSTDAIRKARRSGIGLVGVMKKADKRIRYAVVDEVYIRRINLTPWTADIDVKFVGPSPKITDFDALTFEGLSLKSWLQHRVFLFVANNPVVSGSHQLSFRFGRAVPCQYGGEVTFVVALVIRFKLSGVWVAQKVQIDATSGLYDWISRRVRMGSKPTAVSYNNVQFGKGGTIINCRPDIKTWGDYSNIAPGEMGMELLDLGHFTVPSEYPNLDPLVVAEDADPKRRDIEEISLISDPNWAE